MQGMVPQRKTGRGCKQRAIVHGQHDKRQLDFLEYSAPSDECYPWAQRPRTQEERGAPLLCKAQAKRESESVSSCSLVLGSSGGNAGGEGGVHTKHSVCRRRSCRHGQLNIRIHPPMERRGAPARVVGDEKHSASCLSECPGSLPSSLLLQALKALSKVWLTLEKKIKGIKSQGLETYLKSHLYHVALGVFWNPQSAHWFQRKGPGTDTKFSLPSGATTWKQEPGAFLPRIWKERKCSEAPGKRRSISEERALMGRLRPTWLVVGSAVQQRDVSTVMRTAGNSPRNFLMTEPAGSLGSGETDRPWSCLSSNFQEQGALNKVDTNILAAKVMLSVTKWGEVVSSLHLCPDFPWTNVHLPTSYLTWPPESTNPKQGVLASRLWKRNITYEKLINHLSDLFHSLIPSIFTATSYMLKTVLQFDGIQIWIRYSPYPQRGSISLTP